MFASVGTGETNGIYYPLGEVICGIVNQNLHESGIRCSRETTPGSVYNVNALRDGELEFALIQSDVAYDAYHGIGAYAEAPFPTLRSVLALHSELVTIVARPGIHELGDLAGKRIVAGPAGSGSRATWEAMVKALGWKDGQTPRTLDMPVDAIGNALCKGSIDASLLVLGHPSGKIRDLLSGCALNLIPVDGPAIDSLVTAAPYLKKGPIPANDYGLPADVPSFGVSAILMTTRIWTAARFPTLPQAWEPRSKPFRTRVRCSKISPLRTLLPRRSPRPCIRRPWKCTGSWDS
jgi:TRAP transporter TAXI family solute receptor